MRIDWIDGSVSVDKSASLVSYVPVPVLSAKATIATKCRSPQFAMPGLLWETRCLKHKRFMSRRRRQS
jgi:hypothetical protein